MHIYSAAHSERDLTRSRPQQGQTPTVQFDLSVEVNVNSKCLPSGTLPADLFGGVETAEPAHCVSHPAIVVSRPTKISLDFNATWLNSKEVQYAVN